MNDVSGLGQIYAIEERTCGVKVFFSVFVRLWNVAFMLYILIVFGGLPFLHLHWHIFCYLGQGSWLLKVLIISVMQNMQ